MRDGKFEANGRTFEIVPHGNGLRRLLWWRGPGASQVVGDFANDDVAKMCAARFVPSADKSGGGFITFTESLKV
jgi:hypothetical protein